MLSQTCSSDEETGNMYRILVGKRLVKHSLQELRSWKYRVFNRGGNLRAA
jgi:hypothetical protein